MSVILYRHRGKQDFPRYSKKTLTPPFPQNGDVTFLYEKKATTIEDQLLKGKDPKPERMIVTIFSRSKRQKSITLKKI